MNRIEKLFSVKQKNVCSIYFTAGFPKLNDTRAILTALQAHGADMIEIGMPYSDPLADGPVIQHSSMVALQNGCSIELLFDQLKDCRPGMRVPLILMGYLNPVMQYGVEKFCRSASNVGIDGIILPDLPLQEYESDFKPIFRAYGLDVIFLVTPETSDERVRKIDEASAGFIYAVSSSSITGADKDLQPQEGYFRRLKEMKLKNKIMVGFGIKDQPTFTAACRYSSGGIIGTAYIKAITNSHNIDADSRDFLNAILQPQTTR
jgi:tryptophan synthase alpha chain